MSGYDHTDVRFITFRDDDPQLGGYACVDIRAGIPKTIRVVPPAGEAYAFDRDGYPTHVQVIVSPKGRSVQVWLNGERVS